MKKRLLACVLVLSLLLNLSIPALASDVSEEFPAMSEEDYLLDDEIFVIPDDIQVNAEDFILNNGIMAGSLGATLGLGQIAGLIAAGAGAVFASQYLDDLGVHLDNALNTAAAVVENGREAYMSWLANAVNGDIALASAPSWIAKTILDVMYGLVTSVSPLMASPYAGQPCFPQLSGSVVPAGQPIFYSNVSLGSDGSVTRSSCTYSFDVIPVNLIDTSDNKITLTTYVLYPVAGEQPPGFTESKYVDYKYYYYKCIYNGVIVSNVNTYDPVRLDAIYDYIFPGSLLNIYWGDSVIKSAINGTLSSLASPFPDNVEASPDVLIGGLPDVWVGQGLGSDVITFPDILLDGTGVLAPDSALEGDAAVDAAIESVLDRLATGELAWDDYWIDISKTGTVPTAKVEDTTTGDLVDKPIGNDGTIQDPVVVPDYSTDLKDYTLDLKGIFPFCIPFDLYNFLSCLASDPVAPSWTWSLPYLGSSYSFDVDLSVFDDVAQLFRNFELLLFIVGLGLKTRDLIKG